MNTTKKKDNKFAFMTDDFSQYEKNTQKNESSAPTPEKNTILSPNPKPQVVEASIDSISDQKTKKTRKKTTTKPKNSTKPSTPSSPHVPAITTSKEESSNLGKRSNPNYKTYGVLLPQKAHKKAKILLMDDDLGRDFSDLITELLENWLEEQDP